MHLNLDLSGINVKLNIFGYEKTNEENEYDLWCKTDFCFSSGEWLNYNIPNDEVFLCCEIEQLAEKLSMLLNDEINEVEKFICMEPDFSFVLSPKKDLRKDPNFIYVQKGCEIVDIDLEWRISFWHEGLTANYLSVCLGRENIEYLLCYFKLIIGKYDLNNNNIKSMIKKGILTE